MAARKETPDFFDEVPDPVDVVSGKKKNISIEEQKKGRTEEKNIPIKKKKVGFYISSDLADQFDREFHKLKLNGVPIENKSFLLEAILKFGLNDILKGDKSSLLKKLL